MQKPGADTPFVSSASFGAPKFVPPHSSWGGHAPFALWLMEALRPNSVVELGTHYGYSYFCFCQQVKLLELPTRCAAVDTWKGDEHAGFYDESVFNLVQKTNSELYANFSRLVRATFAEALDQFPDKSIDLLHIDGRHLYEDVKEDFESWLPKLSESGIVLIHDTQVQVAGQSYQVFRYWKELASQFPHFEFMHEYGLGVLAVGQTIPGKLRPLFDAASDPDKAAAIRTSYERLAAALYGRRIRRMEPCPCGSGERFKHCHGTLAADD